MERAPASAGLFARILGAWADLRRSMREELARQPGEGRLLLYLVLAQLFWFAGRAALLAYGPVAPALSRDQFVAAVGWELVTAVFYRSLAFYALAAIGGAIARAAGGTGGWRESRAALFWAALVAAPVMLMAHLLSVILTGVPGRAGAIAEMLGALVFGWTTANCFAEAHGFRSAWRVLGTMAALVAALIGAAYGIGRML